MQSKLTMLYSSWNKWVLSERLKEMSEFALCMWSGSLFQSIGPDFEKAQSPPVTREWVAQQTYDHPKS